MALLVLLGLPVEPVEQGLPVQVGSLQGMLLEAVFEIHRHWPWHRVQTLR